MGHSIQKAFVFAYNSFQFPPTLTCLGLNFSIVVLIFSLTPSNINKTEN